MRVGTSISRKRRTGERSRRCGSVAPRLTRGPAAHHPGRTVSRYRRPRGSRRTAQGSNSRSILVRALRGSTRGPGVYDLLRALSLPRVVEHELWLIGNRVRGLPIYHCLVHPAFLEIGAEGRRKPVDPGVQLSSWGAPQPKRPGLANAGGNACSTIVAGEVEVGGAANSPLAFLFALGYFLCAEFRYSLD